MSLNPELRIIILIFGVYLAASANENSQNNVPCKPGWYFFGEKCYKILGLNSTALNWTSSVQSCFLDEGALASINSNELQEFLTVFLLLNSKSNVWIGLHDLKTESEFLWVDGSLYNYTNWGTGEPSRKFHTAEEDCVEMSYTNFKDAIGTWNDKSCSTLNPRICQVDKSSDINSPDPRFCSIEDGGGWKYLNSCYHIVKEEKSWEDAEKYCEEKYRGYLVSVLDNNAEVYLNYIMELSNLSKNVWIGIKIGNYSAQKWTSGWHVANKKINEEQLHFENDTCVLKLNQSSWAVAPCLYKYPFICEKIKYNVPVLERPPSDDWKCPYSGKKWLDLEGHYCYYIEDESSKNWLEANYDCGKKGGTLASFLSENETNILHRHVLETQARLFIGLRRNSENKSVFEWADGTNFTYQNWHDGEPNYLTEMCGEIWADTMKWNDIDCSQTKGYICKTKKRFSPSNDKKFSDQVFCDSALSMDQTYPSGIPVGTVLGMSLFTLILGLLVGVIIYYYRDFWKQYCTKSKNDVSTSPNSLGDVSAKLIWKSQEDINY